MSQKELEDVIKEIYRLWQLRDKVKYTEEDIDFILNQVIKKIGE